MGATDDSGPKDCPQCGLISDPIATCCDCGYNFATLARRPLGTTEALEVVAAANEYRRLLVFIALPILVQVALIFWLTSLHGMRLGIAVLIMVVCPAVAAISAYRIARIVQLGSPVAWAIGLVVPWVGLVVLYQLVSRAAAFCRRYGLRLRFGVPTRAAITEFARSAVAQ